MTISELRNSGHVLFECVSGSTAYGTAGENSDRDLKGVYIVPRTKFYSLGYPDQVNEDNNNVMFYEAGKFIDLLAKNNPNMLELLAMPEDCIVSKHPLYDLVRPEIFLSKLCKESFAGYAMTQLKKARGLNKKILNPMEEERKSVLDFCYVVHGQGSIPVKEFLNRNNIQQSDCGLSAIAHMRDTFGLYHDLAGGYSGIIRNESSMDVALSSVKEDAKPIAILSFNKDGYSKYLKDYQAYWEWVKNRNEARYENTIEHGKNYDAKNMLHTFRLLDMAEEIGRTGRIVVRRANREELLRIKSGAFAYEELVEKAEQQLLRIEEVYAHSSLPDAPDMNEVNQLLIQLRTAAYSDDRL